MLCLSHCNCYLFVRTWYNAFTLSSRPCPHVHKSFAQACMSVRMHLRFQPFCSDTSLLLVLSPVHPFCLSSSISLFSAPFFFVSCPHPHFVRCIIKFLTEPSSRGGKVESIYKQLTGEISLSVPLNKFNWCVTS